MATAYRSAKDAGAGWCQRHGGNGWPALPEGTQGTLKLEQIGLTLPFVVQSTEGDAIRMAFELDAERTGGLEQVLGTLKLRPAA